MLSASGGRKRSEIIKGMVGEDMSRIDDIKERNQADFSHVSGDLQSMVTMRNWRSDFCAQHHKNDIEYLLSKLEIAEKVLEELTEASLHYRIGGVEEVAAEALQQLRS